MAQTAIAQIGVPATNDAFRTAVDAQLANTQANFTELYGGLKKEVVAATAKAFTIAELSNSLVTNEGQVVSTNVTHTVGAALVAGMSWEVIITETLNAGVYWQLTVPLGHSILYNGTMGTNNGYVRFTQPTAGTIARFRTITMNGGVVVVCESDATTVTVY
jgi:hypothetical protein